MTESKLGNMAQVYSGWAADCRRYEREISLMDERAEPLHAEIVGGCVPNWHVVPVFSGHERITAAHLIARGHKLTATDHLVKRGFGVYVPECEVVEIRRGQRVVRRQMIIPGYVFVFVWDVDRHFDRIVGCPGAIGMLMAGDKVAIVPDDVMNMIRALENAERGPLTVTIDEVVMKKRKRQSRKRDVDLDPLDIVSVHSYSPILEEERVARLVQEHEARIEETRGAFAKAMGLPQLAA